MPKRPDIQMKEDVTLLFFQLKLGQRLAAL